MQEYEQAIFISYAWGDEQEKIVNQIDDALRAHQFMIIRDKRDLGYKGSIRDFMERIGRGNCVVLVISDKYLRSPYCMFELVEIAENKQFYNRIFPIVLSDADIYDPIKRIGYIRHWEAKRAELAEAIKTVDPAHLQGIREEMDRYDFIRDKISSLMDVLNDMNALTPEKHQDANFAILRDAIERRIKENLSIPNTGTAKPPRIMEDRNILTSASEEAAGGLSALRELMDSSKNVRNAVISFRTDFKAAHEQIDRLGDYKELHDLLHRLQFQCYNLIAPAVSSFPHDTLVRDTLTHYALTLEQLAEEARQVVARSSIPENQLTWINDIDLAIADFQSALQDLEPKFLKKVIDRLKRLLGIQPAIINTLLNQSARDLKLAGLLNALQRVCDHLIAPDLDEDNVISFQSGVESLGKLAQALNSLVEEHNHWQMLDCKLRLIDATIDHDLSDLEFGWSDIKLSGERLYIGYPDTWAINLERVSNSLEEALNGNNESKVRLGFRSFHHSAANRFYRVDRELKALCGDVRKIGMPLASLLEMIE